VRILGIELEGNRLIYAVIQDEDGNVKTLTSGRLQLSDTRSRSGMSSFQDALKTIFQSLELDRIAIKQKPERGRMAAGPAALKMEGLILANAPCEVAFISGQKVKACDNFDDELHKYKENAYKVAYITLTQ